MNHLISQLKKKEGEILPFFPKPGSVLWVEALKEGAFYAWHLGPKGSYAEYLLRDEEALIHLLTELTKLPEQC